jgi:hypothetical protein
MRFWKRHSELANLESELRDARPEASDQLVQSVGERLRPGEVPFRRLRVVMVGLHTGLLLFGFAASGGVSYAEDAVEAVITNDGGGNNNTNNSNNIESQQFEEDEGPEDDQYEDEDEGGGGEE